MDDLDPLIHTPTRLRIMTLLAGLQTESSIQFPALQKQLKLTSGNLSVHLRKLEDAGFVAEEKTLEGRVPKTYLSLTPRGRAAFDEYMTALRLLLKDIP